MTEKFQLALFIFALALAAGGVLVLGERWVLKNRLADTEEALQRWRLAWSEHDRWLALASPEIELVLRNLKAQADGKALDVCWPPSATGPWSHAQLREVLEARAAAAPQAKEQTA